MIVMNQVTYCEMCGKAVERRLAKIVYVEGAKLTLCPSCHARVSSKLVSETPKTPVGGKQSLTTIERRGVSLRRLLRRNTKLLRTTQIGLEELVKHSAGVRRY